MRTASDGAAADQFGTSVALSGGKMLVGASGADDPGTNAGAAYLFDAAGAETKLTASDGAAGDEFGNAVAISGNIALVGAAREGRRAAQLIFSMRVRVQNSRG